MTETLVIKLDRIITNIENDSSKLHKVINGDKTQHVVVGDTVSRQVKTIAKAIFDAENKILNDADSYLVKTKAIKIYVEKVKTDSEIIKSEIKLIKKETEGLKTETEGLKTDVSNALAAVSFPRSANIQAEKGKFLRVSEDKVAKYVFSDGTQSTPIFYGLMLDNNTGNLFFIDNEQSSNKYESEKFVWFDIITININFHIDNNGHLILSVQ